MFGEIDMQYFQPVLTGVVVGVVCTWITARLAIQRFRAEWLWERRADAYKAVIEALHNAKAVSTTYLRMEEHREEPTEKMQNDLNLRANLARNAIEKAIDVGSFLLSENAIDRLEKYMNEINSVSREQAFDSYLDENIAATGSCLNDIVPIAKEDLKTEGILKTLRYKKNPRRKT
jgi:hypothetical protein